MSGATFNRESDAFPGHRDEGLLGHSDFAGGPGMAVEATDQKLERCAFGRLIGKANDDHAPTIRFGFMASKPNSWNAVAEELAEVGERGKRVR